MTISSLDAYIAAAKQGITYAKTAGRTSVATGWFTGFDLAGNPGAGTLAGTSTAAGVVPTDATAGFPAINAFGGGNTGVLTSVDFGSSVACRMKLMDMLFKAGAYSFAAGTTSLSSQPSFSSRIPDGTNYSGLQIWIEVSAAFSTGTAWTVQVTYTNEAGTQTRSTVALPNLAAAALTLGRMYQLPLQAGDKGVQRIDSVIVTNGGTAMTAGTFNVLVLRPLWSGRCRIANDGDIHDMTKTGMPEVFDDSALYPIIAADGTAFGVPEFEFEICNG